ncbi:ATP-binding protein [uncultured Actinomyces sp.]|uniref:sensor histidine kinase n=1 Tax=uncultured Actinomyces sp. TaxID=249061 RepID=UPI00288BD475|nr:ATP-binding protein [uncultured Actinomyces sp.]
MSAVGPENERGAARTMLWSATNFATWAPRRRTHLLCALAAGLLALYSTVLYVDLSNLGIWFVLISGLAVALVSVRPAAGGALSLLSSLASHAMIRGEFPFLVVIGPWLCAAILLTRGFPRGAAYGLVALSTAAGFIPFASVNSDEYTALMIVYGPVLLVVAELVRRPRQQADAVADRYRADLERQRLLVVSELHDTVVRDLTRAVMTAEQARLARPGAALARDLSALTTSVRTAVEQLRGSLRAMSDAGGASGLDVLASSAPRPLAEVVDEARAVLAGRGIALEAAGLEALDADAVPPGVHQQLARVLGELVSNMTKYAAPGGARILMETDGLSLEAMVSNAVAPEREGGRRDGSTAGPGGGRAGRDVPWRGPGARNSAVFSSGLGLPGARRRVEALGGTFDVARTSERFTAVLSVPLQIR